MSVANALLPRPSYLALNGHGTEYERPARVIGELPLQDRFLGLARATEHVAEIAGLEAVKTIPFGAGVMLLSISIFKYSPCCALTFLLPV